MSVRSVKSKTAQTSRKLLILSVRKFNYEFSPLLQVFVRVEWIDQNAILSRQTLSKPGTRFQFGESGTTQLLVFFP